MVHADLLADKVFLTWNASCTRTSTLANHFGAQPIRISYLQGKKFLPLLLLRYLISFTKTFLVLAKRRPKVVFMENQPPFLIMACYLYTRLFGGAYVIDSHSGAFNNKKWAWAMPMYRFLAKNAYMNINTNEHHKSLVEGWGGRSIVISDIPVEHSTSYERIDVDTLSVAVVCSFSFDEPVEEIWEAARQCPGVTFYLTGNDSKLSSGLKSSQPENIKTVGFVPIQQYFGLLSSAKAVMVLTTRDHTMQRGAYEALSLDQPIITTDWPVLRKSFGGAAVYVRNDPDSIAEGVRELLSQHEDYKSAARRQRVVRRKNFEATRRKLMEEYIERLS